MKLAREIYDNFIMKEMLSHTHVSYAIISLFVVESFRNDGDLMEILFSFKGIFQRSRCQCTKILNEKSGAH